MATGYITLTPGGAVLSDGSASNAAPGMSRRKGTDANPAKTYLTLDFDWTADEHCWWSFIMPGDYASGGSLLVKGQINSTTAQNVIMGATVAAISAGDADTPNEHAKSTAATVTIAGNTTEARRLVSGSITLNMDGAAAGDLIVLGLFRDGDNASDTGTVDFEFVGAELSYTTT